MQKSEGISQVGQIGTVHVPIHEVPTGRLPLAGRPIACQLALSVVDRRIVGAVVPCQNVLPQREILEMTAITGRER